MIAEIKYFEIRDSATAIIVSACRPTARSAHESWMLATVGFGMPGAGVLVTRLDPVEAHSDPYAWSYPCPMTQAHLHIERHFSELQSGAVIDCQFLRGETLKAKTSGRYFFPPGREDQPAA